MNTATVQILSAWQSLMLRRRYLSCEGIMLTPARVDIRPLKRIAHDQLPRGSALREILLDEPNEMGIDEFLIKIDIWLKLMKVQEQ
jgi:hypothetical protein